MNRALPTPSISRRVVFRRIADQRGGTPRARLRRGDRCPRRSVAAIESHYMQDEIESAAYEFARQVDRGEKVVVGVNRFEESDATKAEVFQSTKSSNEPRSRG